MNNLFARWETAAAIFTILAGSALHFVFAWTGGWPPAAVLAAVNESVWEHLKIGFRPAFGFAAVELACLRPANPNFFVAKAAALLLIPAIITGGFYGYTALLGGHLLVLDIGLFILAVSLGHLASYRLLLQPPLARAATPLALALIATLGLAFASLTYYPLRLELFRDPVTQTFGIRNQPGATVGNQ